jgi:LysM repeat protein
MIESRETARSGNLGANLLLSAVVIMTVLLALYLAQADNLQVRTAAPLRPSPAAVVADVTAQPATLFSLPAATVTATPVTMPAGTEAAAPSAEQVTSVKPTLSPAATAPATAVAILPQCGHVPSGWPAYTVRPGDTLLYLSIHSGATISEIVQANCLERNIIYSGTQLFLPSEPPVRVQCGPPQSWVRYTVQRGDTLFSLARSRGTTVYQVLNANCRTSSYIQAGQQLYLPPLPATATPLPTEPPPPPPPPPTQTPLPPPTATAIPTPVPPTATATAVPATPTPTSTPEPVPPTDTPLPPTATATPEPTEEPPTATPEPTEEATATITVEATDTAVPPETPEP